MLFDVAGIASTTPPPPAIKSLANVAMLAGREESMLVDSLIGRADSDENYVERTWSLFFIVPMKGCHISPPLTDNE
jgi:hypothetical protein